MSILSPDIFWVNGTYFSATSMIGIIALSGIVVNNAIILVEKIRQQMLSLETPLIPTVISACCSRMRPIALTSITTVLGTLMIVTDPVWSGLAWSVVFGLSLSTILTLMYFPTLLVHFSKSGKIPEIPKFRG